MAGKKNINKSETKLKSGRIVIVKEIAIDVIDELRYTWDLFCRWRTENY